MHTTVDSPPEVITCGYCPRSVVFRPTYLAGHALCFDAGLLPASEDNARDGWVPAQWIIDGDIHIVWAPWRKVPYTERRSQRLIARLHDCSGQTKAAMAA